MRNQKIGQIGETIAAEFLLTIQYRILTQNYYTPYGEIDLITFDQASKEIAFIEVKTRTSQNYGKPQDSITFFKKNHLLKSIFHYFQTHKHITIWRLDLIAVKLKSDSSLEEITHFKNILDG